jgi:hypothetical protein
VLGWAKEVGRFNGMDGRDEPAYASAENFQASLAEKLEYLRNALV